MNVINNSGNTSDYYYPNDYSGGKPPDINNLIIKKIRMENTPQNIKVDEKLFENQIEKVDIVDESHDLITMKN